MLKMLQKYLTKTEWESGWLFCHKIIILNFYWVAYYNMYAKGLNEKGINEFTILLIIKLSKWTKCCEARKERAVCRQVTKWKGLVLCQMNLSSKENQPNKMMEIMVYMETEIIIGLIYSFEKFNVCGRQIFIRERLFFPSS